MTATVRFIDSVNPDVFVSIPDNDEAARRCAARFNPV